MNKFILAIFTTFLFLQISYAQVVPPPPDGGCDECDELLAAGLTAQGEACQAANGCTTVPINSDILLLFGLGLSFGTYAIYNNNKKRQFEN